MKRRLKLALGLDRAGIMPLQDGFRRRIGFLQIDAPVFQLIERNVFAGHGAAHIGAGLDNAKIAVQIFDFGFAVSGRSEFIEHVIVL